MLYLISQRLMIILWMETVKAMVMTIVLTVERNLNVVFKSCRSTDRFDFLSDPGVRSMGLDVTHPLTLLRLNWCDSIPTGSVNRVIQGWQPKWCNLEINSGTNACGAIWWPNIEPMHVSPSGSNWDQIQFLAWKRFFKLWTQYPDGFVVPLGMFWHHDSFKCVFSD